MSETRSDARAAAAPAPALLLSEQPMGALHYRIVALCFLAWIFDFYDLILYSFLMVPMAHDLHLGRLEASFALGLSLNLLLMVIVGGSGYFFGPFLGAVVAVLLPEWLRFTEGYYLMAYAVLVIALMVVCPAGLLGLVERVTKPRSRAVASDR